MAQEDKQLLLKDLCARLPYGVKVLCYDKVCTVDDVCISLQTLVVDICGTEDCFNLDIDEIKPYLRPMSSMTEEEAKEFHKVKPIYEYQEYCNGKYVCALNLQNIDWLNTHHFDYRGLIEKGLALEAPKDMYKEK